jgi:uncharacterized protein YrrD
MLKRMEFTEGISVFTADGKQVGKVNRFVLDPLTSEVTHIVVKKGWLLHEDKVVALQLISYVREDRVVLSKDVSDFNQLPPFEEKYLATTTDDPWDEGNHSIDEDSLVDHWYTIHPSHSSIDFTPDYYQPHTKTKRNIPEQTIPLKDGAQVISSDGKHVGNIERLLIEPGSNRATDFVIKHGVLFKQRKIISTYWVKSVEEGKVYLQVSSHALEQLPSYEE